MPRLLTALVVVGTLLGPAGVAGAACREGARVTRSWPEGSDVVRSTVRLCAGGRERTLRRASMRVRGDRYSGDARPLSGTLLTAADARAGRLAIGSLHARSGRRTAVVELWSLRNVRRLFRRAWRPARRAERLEGPDVILTADGDLAWNEPHHYARPLFVRMTVGTIVRVPATRDTRDLAVEDGRTLRWGSEELFEFFDVRPVPGDGCPARRRFVPISDDGQVVITRAEYGPRRFEAYVLRVCLRGSGRDVVIGGGSRIAEDQDDAVPVLVRVPFIAVLQSHHAKDYGSTVKLIRFDLSTGAADVLDEGALTDVRAEGDTVHWKRDGVDRSART